MKIPSIPGEPMIVNGEIHEPLEKSEFDINFLGINGKEVKSNVRVRRKIWFAPSTRTFPISSRSLSEKICLVQII